MRIKRQPMSCAQHDPRNRKIVWEHWVGWSERGEQQATPEHQTSSNRMNLEKGSSLVCNKNTQLMSFSHEICLTTLALAPGYEEVELCTAKQTLIELGHSLDGRTIPHSLQEEVWCTSCVSMQNVCCAKQWIITLTLTLTLTALEMLWQPSLLLWWAFCLLPVWSSGQHAVQQPPALVHNNSKSDLRTSNGIRNSGILNSNPQVFQDADHGHFVLSVGPNLSNLMHDLELLTITSHYIVHSRIPCITLASS
jgi:hypothetical protein